MEPHEIEELRKDLHVIETHCNNAKEDLGKLQMKLLEIRAYLNMMEKKSK
ncbi:hypothetical protein SBA1_100073 [Candidatus Sulfotelmatobacter kueseliae]|uniref:Uncharacterized protein n=1 Tax=Candidatus Sulfotelmatobacter kueseliae TaxID=2042962 RepID=A0A2U3JW98_9BACT|nr:hypothetical protein SBA1_100073 [Candidatus Sulfotelmatobacter kueseliae]